MNLAGAMRSAKKLVDVTGIEPVTPCLQRTGVLSNRSLPSSRAAKRDGLSVGHDIIVVTWLHCARRDVLKVHPRSDPHRPLTGVFATRSPDRPNPLGLHRVTVRRVVNNRLQIGPIEAIDGTPVIDIKPVLSGLQDS
jgi:tRNA-Thr(GGU) m(6)t(6)A37 methyltransferase TsaA